MHFYQYEVNRGDRWVRLAARYATKECAKGWRSFVKAAFYGLPVRLRNVERTLERKPDQTDAHQPTATHSEGSENAGRGDNSTGTKCGSIIKIESSTDSRDSSTPNHSHDLTRKQRSVEGAPECILDSKSPSTEAQ